MRDIHSREFKIPETKLFNEETNRIIHVPETTLVFRHSLISVSEWEMKYGIPYMRTGREWTADEMLYYMKCMTVGDIPDDNVYKAMPLSVQQSVQEYMNAELTATTIREIFDTRKNQNQEVTSELIYAWMVLLQIPPIPFENWQFNKLLTLIRVVNAEQAPKKKMSPEETLRRYEDINERNARKFGFTG